MTEVVDPVVGSSTDIIQECEKIQAFLDDGLLINEIATRLGRSFTSVVFQINELGLRPRKSSTKKKILPRGAGYDKESTRKNLKTLQSFSGSLSQFVKTNGLSVEYLIRAFQTYFPDEWGEYSSTHDIGDQRACEYCGDFFYPSNGKQRFCPDSTCARESRVDKSYFGGNRRQTLGWGTQTCQVCGRSGVKGITPHHILGKDNDPSDSYLVAVCQRCHQVITILAQSKDFADDPSVWETLIVLVWLRRHAEDKDFVWNQELTVRVGIAQ